MGTPPPPRADAVAPHHSSLQSSGEAAVGRKNHYSTGAGARREHNIDGNRTMVETIRRKVNGSAVKYLTRSGGHSKGMLVP